MVEHDRERMIAGWRVEWIGEQSRVFKSLEILAKSENIPTERIHADANKIAQQNENELGREGLLENS